MTVKTKKYKFTVVATDVVIFTIQEGKLKVLLIKMKKTPFLKCWAVPGGLVKPKESLEEAARRHLFSKTGLKDVYLEQLYTFGKVNRDPSGRVVSTAYFALIPPNSVRFPSEEKSREVAWFPVKKLPRVAYDHSEIIQTALSRLRAKLSYTNIVYGLLAKEFTLSELQGIYERILEKKLDKRNFRKKILSLGLLKRLHKKKEGRAHRPAELYSFIKKEPQIIEIL